MLSAPCPVCATESTVFGRFRRCPSCQCVFDPAGSEALAVEHSLATKSQLAKLPPAGFEAQTNNEGESEPEFKVRESSDGSNFSLRWKTRGYAYWQRLLLAGTLVIFSGLISWLTFEADNFQLSGPLPSVFLVSSLAVYFTVASLVNTLAIHVRDGTLELRHGPLPHLSNQAFRVAASDIEQIWAIQDPLSQNSVIPSPRFRVMFRRHCGEERTLVEGIEHHKQALWIERELESRLGIKDRAVVGELLETPLESNDAS